METFHQNQLNGRNGGNTPKITKTLAKQICTTLANSDWSLIKLCQEHPEWPDYFVMAQKAYVTPWFSEMMRSAREIQADRLAMQTHDVARETLRKNVTMPEVQASKLVCENSRWYASKVLKRMYGDDQQINVDARTAVVVGDEQLKDLRARLNSARELVKDKPSVTPSQDVTHR